MYQAVEEGSGGQNHGSGAELYIERCLHSGDSLGVRLDEEAGYGVLPKKEVRLVFYFSAPGFHKPQSVALCARAPDGGAFTAVEHTELDGGFIGDEAHETTERINFPYDLSFGDASHGGIAAHLCNLVHVHGDEECFGAKACGGGGGFTAGMSGAYDDDVIQEIHY